MTARGLNSFRVRFLLLVLGAAILPLVVLGLWLTRDVANSGEAIVQRRLQVAVEEAAARVGQRWVLHRSLLLDAVGTAAVRAAVREGRTAPPAEAAELAGLDEFRNIRLRGAQEQLLFTLRDVRGVAGAVITMILPLRGATLGDEVGRVEAELPVTALLPPTSPALGGTGTIVGLYEPETIAPLLPLPFSVTDGLPLEVDWGGERWHTVARRMSEPPVVLVAAAPVSPFGEPFREAAREGVLLLAGIGLGAFLVALVLIRRWTHSLGRLAVAAEAVAGGDLDLEVDDAGDDEVGRVGRAFNRMTRSLRGTLQELSDHRALAAVGEFAASLAHEIRNPLSAARLDLQVVEEELPAGSPLRALQRRALGEIERMDATLGGALQTARGGRWEHGRVRVEEPVRAAVESAMGQAGATVVEAPGSEVRVMGDSGALRQLFLNLLLNACEAAGPGGRVEVTIELEDSEVLVCVVDDGPGIPEELRGSLFEPLVSGRPGGTGLGLSIAARIARSHGGEIELRDRLEGGTVAQVRLPVVRS